MMSSRPMMMTYSTPQYMPVMTNTTGNPPKITTTTAGTAQLQAPSMQSPSLSTWAAQPTYAWTGPQQQQQQQQMMMNACGPGAMSAMMNQGSPSGNSMPPMFALTNSANATPTTSSHAPVSHTSSSSNSSIPHTGAISPASPMAMSMSGTDKNNNNNNASANAMMRQNNTPPFVPRMPCAETPYVLNGLPVTFTEANNNNPTTTTAMMMGGTVSANTAPVTQQQQQQQCPMTPAMTTAAPAPYNLTAYLTTASATTTMNNNSNGDSYITLSNTPPSTTGTMMMMPMTTAPTATAYSALGSETAAAAAAPPAMLTAATLMQPTVLLPSTPFDGTVFLQALPTSATTTTGTTVQPMTTTAMMMMPPPPPPMPEEHRWNGTQYELNGLYEGYVKRYNPVRGFGFLTATHRLLPKTVLHIPHFPQEMGNEGNNNSTTTAMSDHAMASSVTTTPTMGDALHDAFASQSLEPQLIPMSVTGSEAMYGVTNAPPRPVSGGLHFHRIPVILGDIFVHQSYLMMRGFRSLPLSGRVRFRVGPMPGRSTLQAIEVELLPQVVPADIRRSMMTEQQQQQQPQPLGLAENNTSTNNNDNMTLMSRVTSVNDTSRCGQEEEDKLCGTQNSAAMTESPPLVTASLTGLSVAAAEHTPRGTLTLPFSEQQQLLLDSGFYDTVMAESDPLTLGHLAFSMEDIVLGEDGTQAQSQHGEAGKRSGSGFDISLLDFDNRESEPTREAIAAVTSQPRYTAYQQVMRH